MYVNLRYFIEDFSCIKNPIKQIFIMASYCRKLMIILLLPLIYIEYKIYKSSIIRFIKREVKKDLIF
jgi:hypothetical protein